MQNLEQEQNKKTPSRAHIIRTTPKNAQIAPLTLLDELVIRQVLLHSSAVFKAQFGRF